MQFLNNIIDSFQGPPKTMLKQAKHYQALEKRIQHLLQVELKVMRLIDQKLVLQVSDAALATRIKYRSAQFLGRLHQEGLVLDVRQIVIHVRPIPAPPEPKRRAPTKISEENQALLAAHAEAIQPSALRDALFNLSKRSE